MLKKGIYWIFSLLILFSACGDSKKKEQVSNDLTELNRLIEKHPKDADLLYKRSNYYFDQGDIENALADALAMIKNAPDNAQYYIYLSDIYFSMQETDLAEETLQKSIALDPDNNEARLKLAELYFHLKMTEESMAVLDEAIQRQTHNPKAHLIRAFNLKDLGDTTGYLRILQLVIDQDPTEIKAFLELGYFYQKQLDPIAMNYYQNALRIDPSNKEINYNLGLLYQDLGEIELAIEQYNNLLKINPDDKYAYNNLGYIDLVFKEDYNSAVEYFTKAIDQDSLFINAVCNRGIAYMNLEVYDKAREDFIYCRTLNPQFEPAIIELNRLDNMNK